MPLAVNLSTSDADEDALVYALLISPSHGSLTGEGRAWVYHPTDGFTGQDSLTFLVRDGQLVSAAATVTLQVTTAPAEASVGGLVYEDRNGNGQPDGDDVGVGGLLVTLAPADAQTFAELTTLTETGGGWRLAGAPFGQYTLRISSANGIQLAAPVTTSLTIDQRGLQQSQPTAVKVTSRALFLPLIQQ